MTTKERAYLRSLAMTLKPIFQIGKNGISENQVIDISNALEAHELIKINALKNSDEDIMEIANEIAQRTNSVLVQVVGNKITLYRKSETAKKHIMEE